MSWVSHARFEGSTRSKVAVGVGAVFVGVLLPQILDVFYTRMLTHILILGLFGVVFNWAFGYTNLPAFGHAAFFGLGAYGFAMALQQFPDSFLMAVLTGVVVATVYSIVVGWSSVRGRGIYFALITFAFAQFVYEVFFRMTDLTGGSNGLIVFAPDVLGFPLTTATNVYYLSLGLLILSLLVGYRLVNSPYGRLLVAIHYNEERARAIGYPVNRVKVSIFVITAAFSSFAGILFALNNQFISPAVLHWQTSVDALIITIIGGTSTLLGPLVGAVVLVLLRESTSDLANIGTIMIGGIFIITILLAPQGIVGFLKRD